MTTEQKKLCITADFEVDQMTDSLSWSIVDANDHSQESMNGLYKMNSGDTVHVLVTAHGVTDDISLNIIECCLVTQPVLFSCTTKTGGRPGSYPYPSPFFQVNTGQLGVGQAPVGTINSMLPLLEQFPTKLPLVSFKSPTLEVTCAGRWKTSLLMTVAITHGIKSVPVTTYHVYTFDPESDSSSGVIPP